MTALTVAINAGGQSSRMGADKALVDILGQPLIEHIIERVSHLGQVATMLISNRPDDYTHLGLPLVGDVLADKGSLGGIYTALHHSQTPYTLVVACDMPFLNPALLRYMIDLCDGDQYDVIVPRVEGYPQGLHAIYSQNCLEPIRARLDADRLKVIGFYDQVRVRYIDEPEYTPLDPKGLSFSNVNTPEELEAARHKAKQQQESGIDQKP